jgi:hypothetical protein
MSAASGTPDDAEIVTRLRLALERLDRSLTEQEIEAVRSRIEHQQVVLRQIRAVPLANGDEPAPGFDPSPLRRLQGPVS